MTMHHRCIVLLVSLLSTIHSISANSFFGSSHSEKDPHAGNYGDLAQVKQHIKHHLEAQRQSGQSGQPIKVPTDTIEGLMYLFKFHDFNNDNMLDGHEMIFALSEWDGEEGGRNKGQIEPLKDLEDDIEHILQEDDENNDNVISIEEYLKSAAYHDQI